MKPTAPCNLLHRDFLLAKYRVVIQFGNRVPSGIWGPGSQILLLFSRKFPNEHNNNHRTKTSQSHYWNSDVAIL